MFGSAEFWVFIAFLAFLGIFGKKAYAFLVQALDDHRDKVAQQLNEAQRLHDEAQSLLKSYKTKHKEAVKQSEKIIHFAEEEAKELNKASKAEFERFMASKEKALTERMAVEKADAISQLREEALEEALKIVEDLLASNPTERNKLTDSSLKEISKLSLKSKK